MSSAGPARGARTRQAGFTLIELLIAMTVTVIITGAMYGLLSGGQNAFRREPDLTDRQQAIRMAMDRIQRDVMVAGQKMGAFAQAFTSNLNGVGNRPINGGVGPITGPNGDTDILEIVGNTGECPDLWIGIPNGDTFSSHHDVPDCYPTLGPLLLLYPNGEGKLAWGRRTPGMDREFKLPISHQAATNFSHVAALTDIACPISRSVGTSDPCPDAAQLPTGMAQGMVVRYLIAPDPTDGIPSLWRSSRGGFSHSATAVREDPLNASADAGWRMIARGVEDLQAQYRDADSPAGVWRDTPRLVGVSYDRIVREVRVTLGARTLQTTLAGARTSTQGDDAVRGQLVATMTPRAAMFHLGQQTQDWH